MSQRALQMRLFGDHVAPRVEPKPQEESWQDWPHPARIAALYKKPVVDYRPIWPSKSNRPNSTYAIEANLIEPGERNPYRTVGEFEVYRPQSEGGTSFTERVKKAREMNVHPVNPTKDAEIAWVGTEHPGQGIAHGMLRQAMATFHHINIRHSGHMSDEGEKWARSRPELRTETPERDYIHLRHAVQPELPFNDRRRT